jgi:tripartite ATP-independent transporter DctM subunit
MSDFDIGLVGLGVLFMFLALRMPVGLAMIAVGLCGTAAINGWSPALTLLSGEAFAVSTFYQLIVIPMFLLMGNLASVSGMGRDLYAAAYAWIGHMRGGLASATIVASAFFAALSGSSLASAVTLGRVALPEMKRFNYADSLATGAVAAGGTLGFLIPPSAGMVIYAILTEQSIGRLFLAGVIPGIILTGLFVVAIRLVCGFNKEAGPPGPRADIVERVATAKRSITILVVIVLTIGGIYVGAFTPVEASGIGAFLTLIVAIARKRMDWPILKTVVLQTMRTCATVFLILIGAHVFIPFMALSHVPEELVSFLLSLGATPMGLLAIVLVTYMVLGTFMEGFSMLVLTLPVVLPLLQELGTSLIWFGVVVVIVLEMGLISPPVGINVFVVKGIAPEVPMNTIFRGIWPFWFAMAICVGILLLFPDLALFLPNTMF